MVARELFRWKVQLQASTGEMVEREVQSYWSPGKEGTAQAIGEAAAAEAYMASGKTKEFAPIKMEHIPA